MPTPFTFTSKANTLATLATREELCIPPVVFFTQKEWTEEAEHVLEKVAAFSYKSHNYSTHSVAVRSSSMREDTANQSSAGAFTSLLHIPATDKDALRKAIDTVFQSYGQATEDDQVLIQPMLQNIVMSGVMMTCALDDGSPYYVINYDDESCATDSVTSGRGKTKTVYIYRNAKEEDFDNKTLYKLVQFAGRLETICQCKTLDIEFATTQDNVIHLLQVRPICTQNQWIKDADVNIAQRIGFIKSFLHNRMKPKPQLFGKTTILGVMPDWNPAEMIGIMPRPLASSLYRELITRKVWSKARECMGYRPMPPDELMVFVGGRPYIDVRLSFNSFLPKGLDAVTSEVLVSAWLERLNLNTVLHDKIEFQVAQTVMDFCFDKHLDERFPGLLTHARRTEFRHKLQDLTNKCMNLGQQGTMAFAYDAIAELYNRQVSRQSLFSHNLKHVAEPLSEVAIRLEECKDFGTLPFSILARHGFIAEALLRTAVIRDALAPERLLEFRRSVQTIAGTISHDFFAVARTELSKDTFIEKYGHLRPCTYDILSPAYAHRPDLFDYGDTNLFPATEHSTFVFSDKEKAALTMLLREAGLNESVEHFEQYARKAICGREYAKFVFSRNISEALELLALWGQGIGLDRETLSYISIHDIMEWLSQALLTDPEKYFQKVAKRAQGFFELGRSLKLAYIIRSARDVMVAAQHNSAPNFVTQKNIEAPLVFLDVDSPCSTELTGKIVCIENADPGFDWIFTRNIAGLITMFGGTNSHMTIRCAEYDIPAAIGVGGTIYQKLRNAQRCLLNAENSTIQGL